MSSWFVRIMVAIATINLLFFALPYLYVMIGSDISLSVLTYQGAPLHIAIWIHRNSVLQIIAAIFAIIVLIKRKRYGNYIAAGVLGFFAIQMCFTTTCTDEPPAEGPLPRLKYDNEEYGRKVEKQLKYYPIAIEVLLIGVLVSSKRIRQVYVKQNRKS